MRVTGLREVDLGMLGELAQLIRTLICREVRVEFKAIAQTVQTNLVTYIKMPCVAARDRIRSIAHA